MTNKEIFSDNENQLPRRAVTKYHQTRKKRTFTKSKSNWTYTTAKKSALYFLQHTSSQKGSSSKLLNFEENEMIFTKIIQVKA